MSLIGRSWIPSLILSLPLLGVITDQVGVRPSHGSARANRSLVSDLHSPNANGQASARSKPTCASPILFMRLGEHEFDNAPLPQRRMSNAERAVGGLTIVALVTALATKFIRRRQS